MYPGEEQWIAALADDDTNLEKFSRKNVKMDEKFNLTWNGKGLQIKNRNAKSN